MVKELKATGAKVARNGHSNGAQGSKEKVHILEDANSLSFNQRTRRCMVYQALSGEAKGYGNAIVDDRPNEADVEGFKEVLRKADGDLD